MVDDFPGWNTANITVALHDKVKHLLTTLIEVLEPANLHFGMRTMHDVLAVMTFSATQGMDEMTALDNVLYAKVLPKLRGENSHRFDQALAGCRRLFELHELARCTAKVIQLQQSLQETGAARFWR